MAGADPSDKYVTIALWIVNLLAGVVAKLIASAHTNRIRAFFIGGVILLVGVVGIAIAAHFNREGEALIAAIELLAVGLAYVAGVRIGAQRASKTSAGQPSGRAPPASANENPDENWKEKYLAIHAELTNVTNRTERRKLRIDEMQRRLRDWRYAWQEHRNQVLKVIDEYSKDGVPMSSDAIPRGALLMVGWYPAWQQFFNEITPYIHDPTLTDKVPRLKGNALQPSLPAIAEHEAETIVWIDKVTAVLRASPDALRENFEGFKTAFSWPFPAK
jgi:hypothetical protein